MHHCIMSFLVATQPVSTLTDSWGEGELLSNVKSDILKSFALQTQEQLKLAERPNYSSVNVAHSECGRLGFQLRSNHEYAFNTC